MKRLPIAVGGVVVFFVSGDAETVHLEVPELTGRATYRRRELLAALKQAVEHPWQPVPLTVWPGEKRENVTLVQALRGHIRFQAPVYEPIDDLAKRSPDHRYGRVRLVPVDARELLDAIDRTLTEESAR